MRRLIPIMLILAAVLFPTGKAQGKKEVHKENRTKQVMLSKRPQAQGADSVRHFSIFGKDDRFEITDTQRFPWSAVALVRVYWSADDLVGYSCTGWMIGPSMLATAAHCIYQNGYPDHVVIKPAMNTDAPVQTPFGTCAVINGVVPNAWIQSKSMEYDYGVYRLECSVGEQTGTLGFKITSGDRAQKQVQLTGYPNDKPGRTMWSANGTITSSTGKGLYYDVDMWPGQSGSPVWDTTDASCAYCVVAMNSSEFAAPAMNFGTRIDQEAFDFLRTERDFQPTP